MKKKCFCLLLAACLVLCGCAAQDEPAETAPPLETSLDTCAESSRYTMAETEDGFYWLRDYLLYYADKSDLSNWVVVCNQPDCSHGQESCPAWVGHGFYLRNNRIYSLRNQDLVDYRPDLKYSMGIYSTKLDGTDLKKEYDLTLFPYGGATHGSYLYTPYGIFFNYSKLRTDGDYDSGVALLAEDGMHVLEESVASDEEEGSSSYPPSLMQGDFTAYMDLSKSIDDTSPLYRFTADGYEDVPGITAYDLLGAYLSGDQLYRFVQNDGYYRTNLSTGESVKWMDAQMTDSTALQLGPSLLLETNLCVTEEHPEIRLYRDGVWQTIALPENFPCGDSAGLPIPVLTRDGLLFRINHHDPAEEIPSEIISNLYFVDLTRENPEAVFCAELTSSYG